MKHSILCVDDEVDNVDALERLFRKDYRVLKATSGRQALELLANNPVSVIITDQRMPQMSGVEMLAESIKTHPATIRILLTGYTDIESVIASINSGHIYRYVTKPWDPIDLSNAVNKAVERFEIGEELKRRNIELKSALDELKTLDEAKNHFMILINHELKTPLTSILSFGELLAESKLTSEQTTYLSRIKTSAHRLQELVNDSLEIISAETQQMKLDPRPHMSKTLIASWSDPILVLSKNRKIEIKTEIENREVVVDEKIIKNVLRRLVHNAVKFADPNTEIVIAGKAVGPKRYEFRIVNSGPRIEPTKINHILKPFALNESILHHSTGNGLGLAVCQSLLRHQGSALSFESQNSKIEVSFTIPL